MKTVLHITTSLDLGGSEMMLFKLVKGMDRTQFKSIVISLMDIGIIGERIKRHGIPVFSLGIPKGGVPRLSSLMRLLKIIQKTKPDIVQGWMYHGNLASWVVGCFFFRGAVVFWNIRQSLDDSASERKMTRMIIKIGACFSSVVERTIYNSSIGLKQHTCIGYSNKNILIPNGFDVSLFKPRDVSNYSIRKEFGLKNGEKVIGLIARYHPVKGHKTFLEAANRIVSKADNIRFLMAGTGVDWNNKYLIDLIEFYGLRDFVILLGEQRDVKNIMYCLDVLVSSSYAEAFSNVIGEAMACGVPCVVTDVGDSAFIVKDTGMVVPPSNAKELASAIMEFIGLSKKEQKKMGTLARQRVVDCFSMDKIVKQYEALYLLEECQGVD